MDRRRAAGALLALAACIACSTAAPTASNQTALELLEGPSEGCYYNFQHYGEGDRIMTNEPCLNCTCHNKMLMCYLRVCPFTKAIGQDCTIEKRADQCCPIVTCPDVPVDLLTSTSTSSPAEYGATGLGKVDKYGCSINGKYFSEGSKVPPTPNKPCEHCYCIRNMTTCVMQECTLHVDGCTPIYHKDVCCPVRYSCDHLDDEMLLLDDMTTTVRPTPGFLLTTTTTPLVTQMSQDCVHDDQIFADGALIKTEKACEHCYCMKGDIVCVVQECGTPMENEGKNCTSLPPRQGQCCPDTYICEGDDILTEVTTGVIYEELTTFSPPRRVEGSGYRNEPDEPYTEIPTFEGSGEEHATTLDSSDMFTSQKQTPQIIDEMFAATEEPHISTIESDKEQNTVPYESNEGTSSHLTDKIATEQEAFTTLYPTVIDSMRETDSIEAEKTTSDYRSPTESSYIIPKDEEYGMTTESAIHYTYTDSSKIIEIETEIEAKSTESSITISELTTQKLLPEPSSTEVNASYGKDDETTTLQSADVTKKDEIFESKETTTEVPKDSDSEYKQDNKDKESVSFTPDKEDTRTPVTTFEPSETTSINPVENEIDEDILPPGRIPGEGDCLLNGITYKNNTSVPNINNCHSSCRCISSIVKCDPIICSPPPEHMDNMNDCQPIFDTPDACCPTYVCHSRETIPPESHSQMSGTESPKPLSEKPESVCQDNECQPQETKPVPQEPCDSENCKPIMQDHEKCKNGVCDHVETSPPLTYPQGCIGDTCLPSEESCNDEKCQVTTPNETICDNKTGCQPSEACKGDNCVVGPEATIPTDELSGCKDSEACKSNVTSICEGSQCDTPVKDTIEQNENILPECTEESCRRKEQSQEENKPPSECSDSSCSPQEEVKDDSSLLTTESGMQDQIYKESTTEIVHNDYSKLPELEETPTQETHKVTDYEAVVTEKQHVSHDTTIGVPLQDSIKEVTEEVESHTKPSELQTMKIEETFTEIYHTPDSETTYVSTPKSEEDVTEVIEHATKEISTKSPLVTQFEEHTTELHIPDIGATEKLTEPSFSTPSVISSTDRKDIQIEDQENKKETDTTVSQEFTERQESATNPTIFLETTSEKLDAVVTGHEYTHKHEMYTESPIEQSTLAVESMPIITEKEDSTKMENQESGSTESETKITITESTIISLPEMSTEKHVDTEIPDDNVKYTAVDSEVTYIPEKPTGTEQAVTVEQSSESYETKLEETATSKIHADKEQISTESPIQFTEMLPTETSSQEHYKIEEKPEISQTTEKEPLVVNVDTGKETTASPIDDQQELSQPSEIPDTITDKQEVYTKPGEISEYETHAYSTESTATEENLEKQTHGVPEFDKDEPSLPESSIKESPIPTISQDFAMKETSTEQTKVPITISSEITTENIDFINVSSDTESNVLEDTSVNDLIEPSTNGPEHTLQEYTTHRDYSVLDRQETTTNVVQEAEKEVTTKPIETTSGFGTTISSILSDTDQEKSTKPAETLSDMEPSEEIILTPEELSTKLDESTSVPTEIQRKTTEPSISSQVEGEVTTEPLKQTDEEKGESPDYPTENIQTQEPIDENFNKISTEAPITSYVDAQEDINNKATGGSIDESKTEGTPLDSTPEKQDTTILEDHVTKGIESDVTILESDEDKYTPTEQSILNEKQPQDISTHAPEITTQDTETKSVTELQTEREITTPQIVHKEEKDKIESPMSLVTEAGDVVQTDDGTRNAMMEETTQNPNEKVSDEEKAPVDIKPQMPYTVSPQITETEIKFDTETSSKIYPEKESEPESSFTSQPQEYTTFIVADVLEKDKTTPIIIVDYDDVSTEVGEKLAPTIDHKEADEDISTQHPVKIDSESYPNEILHESTSTSPVKQSTEEPFISKDQEISTEYPDTFASMTTVNYDNELDTKPEDTPIKEHTVEHTVQTQGSIDFTTPGIDKPEISKGEDDTEQQEHTISPDFYTTKDLETLDISKEKETDENKPSIQEETTLGPEQHVTTDKIINTEQTISHDSSLIQDKEKSTNVMETTTTVYQDLTTFKLDNELSNAPESHLSTISILGTTSNILTTESSDISLNEEDHRRTLSPSFENVQSDEVTTEKQGMTELPDILSGQEIETTQKLITNAPEIESTTKININEEIEHVTLTPQQTETDILVQTETIPIQEVPVVTESIDEHFIKDHDASTKSDTQITVSDDLNTELPSIIEKDQTTEKTTVDGALINVLIGTMTEETPLEHPKEQGSESETTKPKEDEIFGSTERVPSEIVTDISEPEESDTTIPKATEPSTLNDSDITTKVTEPSTSKETDTTELKVTASSLPEESAEYIPGVTEVSLPAEVETLVPEITKSTGHHVTEASIPDITETFVSKVTDGLATEKSEEAMPEVTESSEPEIPEILTKVTEAVVTEVTDSSVPKETVKEFIDIEPESTTYKQKDETLGTSEEQSPTLEPINPLSETTPYLVELQEHTTKVIEDIPLATIMEEGTTRSPETYQTERGDQPLDNLPDKSPQEEFHAEQTTKEPVTKKDELLTTLPVEQSSEYPAVPAKTEIATEEASLSPETSIPTLSTAEIVQHTESSEPSGEQIVTTSPTASVTNREPEKHTTYIAEIETTTYKKDLVKETEKIPEQEVVHETEDELIPTISKTTTVKIPEYATTHPPVLDDKFTQPEDKPAETYSPTTAPELPKPGFNEVQPTDELPSPDFPTSGTSGYGQEPDYVEEDQAFGPGTCRYGGKVYVSAQQIPRDDPCDFCFCFRSDIICLQQSCPPPIHGCHEEPIQGFCCPRYECPVSMATTLNVTTTTTTTTTTLPPHFLPHAYKGAAQRRGCQIKGHSYKVGEVVRASSGPCLHCTCGGDGQMKCDPKACTPEPMLRQMIAAAVSAKRRR